MNKCGKCRYFLKNPMNTDGKCEKDKDQHSNDQDCCNDFREKLSYEQLYIIDFSRIRIISRSDYENFGDLKKKVFENLRKKGYITKNESEDHSIFYVNQSEIERAYSDIFE